MLMTIDTYTVIVHGPPTEDNEVFRVPQTDLDAFVRVLNFNRREYEVKREPAPTGLVGQGSASGGLPAGWKIS